MGSHDILTLLTTSNLTVAKCTGLARSQVSTLTLKLEDIIVFHLRHDESLFPRLTQNPIHKKWNRCETIFAPRSPFIKTQPNNRKEKKKSHQIPKEKKNPFKGKILSTRKEYILKAPKALSK